ncbi:GFA family protein [Ochrobactrum pecoris]|uniref:GFA family protein n=2 Tax=Brucella pecoris TaxID=867683 RepID=A0A5C5CBF1_9HYPH|nr:GFA family protein [Brucella pecoris]NKW81497.1 GFA family protein [Brucella pecoris]TNV08577.1 GFA family protein [Brucella pecoris]
MNGERRLNGRCACEAVRFTVSDEFEYALNCHCSLCRRSTGSAFKAFGGIRTNALEETQDKASLMLVGNEIDHDVRCAFCGSYLYSIVRDGEYVHVNFGTLADEPSLKPSAHIFVGSKAAWYDILDDLPQFEEHPAL